MRNYFLIVFLTVSAIFYQEASAKKGKTRSLILAKNECNEINEILANSSQTHKPQWQASYKNDFALTDNEDIPLGVLEEPPKARAITRKPPANRKPAPKPGEPDLRGATGRIRLPRTYNAREVYSKRCPSLDHIQYQGSCGNCWAVATMSMINDRICMYQDENEPQRFYSAKHLTTCLKKGCDGGWFADALQFWVNKGLVEGGDYRMGEPPGCKPYPRDTAEMKGAMCNRTCDDGRVISEDDKSYGGARYEIRSRNAAEIMGEIYMYGPVIATFDVYEDFAHYYKSGVYKRVSTKKLGAHAAKLYGWGVENGVPFWYAANSWGTTWGDVGFFKIQRGTNEVNIENNIHAAIPQVALATESSGQASITD